MIRNESNSIKTITQHFHKTLLDSNNKYHHHLICGILGLIIFASHYLKTQDFLVFEDDWFFIFRHLRQSNILEALERFWFNWPQGRPTGFTFAYFYSALFTITDKIWFLYFIGYILLVTNSFFIYKLVEKFSDSKIGFIAAITFVLLPADLTKAYITHSMLIQPAIFLTLLSLWFSLREKYLQASIFIFLALTTYETVTLAYFAAVVMLYCAGSIDLSKAVRSVSQALITFTGYGLIRVLLFKEVRAVGDTPTLIEAFSAPLKGVGWLFETFSLQTASAFADLQLSDYIVSLIILCISMLPILAIRRKVIFTNTRQISGFQLGIISQLILFIICVLGTMLVAFYFDYKPFAGRATRVFAAFQLAAPFFVLWFCRRFLFSNQNISQTLRFIGIAGLATIIFWSSTIALRTQIQMVRISDIQASFYQQFEKYTGALDSDEVLVIIDFNSYTDRGYLAFTWGTAWAIRDLWAWKDGDVNVGAPRVFTTRRRELDNFIEETIDGYKLVRVQGVQPRAFSPQSLRVFLWKDMALSEVHPEKEFGADFRNDRPFARNVDPRMRKSAPYIFDR